MTSLGISKSSCSSVDSSDRETAGAYMARVFEGQRTFLHPVLRAEVSDLQVAGIREEVEQRWTHYTAALLSFSLFGFLLTYVLQRAQAILPFNPQHFNAIMCHRSAFNTATSFVTNTNCRPTSANRP